MAVLEIKLKQHSPMIHFQWQQKGAGLRATEVKPRLDEYLREKFPEYSGNNLRYIMRIHGGDKNIDNNFRNEPYFGNQHKTEDDSGYKKKKSQENIILSINTYFDNILASRIEETMPIVLALNNFGTRKTKGYGSFFPSDMGISEFETYLKKNSKSDIYYWETDERFTLNNIKIFNDLLKSGINLKHKGDSIYTKPLIYYYFKDQGIVWEKKKIKNDLLSRAHSDTLDSDDKRFIRAILGLSSISSWFYKPYEDDLGFGDPELVVNSMEFDRIPSSLTFKIFKNGNRNRVYLFFAEVYLSILDKEFEFHFQSKNDKDKHSKPVSVFSPQTFDCNTFLDYVYKNMATHKIDFVTVSREFTSPKAIMRSIENIMRGYKKL